MNARSQLEVLTNTERYGVHDVYCVYGYENLDCFMVASNISENLIKGFGV